MTQQYGDAKSKVAFFADGIPELAAVLEVESERSY
jgi:hypothetical protein